MALRRCDALILILILILSLSACSRSTPQAPYDLVIVSGSVIDGEGGPARSLDIGIRDGRIVSLGSLSTSSARQRIDATGLTVAPGFIDMHNHSDFTILVEPKSESMIRQGVTTMVLGESRSAGPVKPGVDDGRRADGVTVDWTTLGGYFDRLERQHMATNIASYVGQEQVWTYVKGYDQSPATPAELAAMKTLVAQAMEDGAMGLSTSLLQPPSSLATTDNLVELATIAKQHGGIYSSHIRDEGEGVFRAVEEAIQVGKGAGIRVDIIHMKIAHQKLWGRVNEVIAMVQKARDAGFDIQANVYPYTAGSEQPVVDHSAVGARRWTREDGAASARSGGAAADARGGAAGTSRLVQPLFGHGRRLVRHAARLVEARAKRPVPGQAHERAHRVPRRRSCQRSL